MSGVYTTWVSNTNWHISIAINSLKIVGVSKAIVEATLTKIKIRADFAVESSTLNRMHPAPITPKESKHKFQNHIQVIYTHALLFGTYICMENMSCM